MIVPLTLGDFLERAELVYGCAHHHGYETNVSLERIATPAGKAVVLDSADARWRV